MSKISIDLIWKLDNGEMSPGKYSNQHEIIFTPNMKMELIQLQIGEVVN